MKNSQKETYFQYENQIIRINDLALKDAADFVRTTEEKYRDSLVQAARFIKERTGDMELVMLAGPSSSGKTTTARMLMGLLEAMGLCAVSISLDDFYKNEEESPKLPDRRPDFESIYALNIQEIQETLLLLERNHSCEMVESWNESECKYVY